MTFRTEIVALRAMTLPVFVAQTSVCVPLGTSKLELIAAKHRLKSVLPRHTEYHNTAKK